ncbi:hypothetical protein [Listeria goaensis]|uniref:hypothetical protein n=1 Tax=Listeria goaensis TaxID=1649188 RepID=UPI00135664E6|nr:hypothetical protein [Listeria goaensis]
MTTWWIRIVEVHTPQSEPNFFIGQEMSFCDFYYKISSLNTEIKLKIRYELNQTTQNGVNILAKLTWDSKQNLDVLSMMANTLEKAVQQKLYDKKAKRKLLEALEEEINRGIVGQTQLETDNPLPYPPTIEKKEQEAKIVKNRGTNPEKKSKSKEPHFKIQTFLAPIQKNFIEFFKKRREKQSPRKKNRIQSTYHSCKEWLKKRRKRYLRLLFGVSISVVLLIGSGYAAHHHIKSEKPSAQTLLKQGKYQNMAKQYPQSFWKWEQEQVVAVHTETLEKVYRDFPNTTIELDLAFLKKEYAQVIQLYETEPKKIRLNATRYSFAAFSYIQVDDLAKAEEVAAKSQNDTVSEHLALAYLKEGQIEKAEQWNIEIQSDKVSQKIKDYQLLNTTLQEINQHLKKPGLSESIRKQLIANQKAIQQEIQKIKDGKDEISS